MISRRPSPQLHHDFDSDDILQAQSTFFRFFGPTITVEEGEGEVYQREEVGQRRFSRRPSSLPKGLLRLHYPVRGIGIYTL